MSPPGNRVVFEMFFEQHKATFSSQYDPETSSGTITIGSTNVKPEHRGVPNLDILPDFPPQLLNEQNGWKTVDAECLATLCDMANIQQDNLLLGVVGKTLLNNNQELLFVNHAPVCFNEVIFRINSCSLYAFNAILANLGIQPAMINHEAAEAHQGADGNKKTIQDVCGR